ncbi:MAG: hypothetical protein AB7G13_11615 [Lautropia sp.]
MAQQITTNPVRTLQQAMEFAGWQVRSLDLDLTGTAPRVTVDLMRNDGRRLWAHVDSIGRATLETFQRETTLDVSDYGRRAPRCDRHVDVFLGRQRTLGGRSLLRAVTAYIADNSLRPVALGDVRAAWALAMNQPALIGAAVPIVSVTGEGA